MLYDCIQLNPITCVCVSEDKRWLVTGDKGVDSMVNVWDTYTWYAIYLLHVLQFQHNIAHISSITSNENDILQDHRNRD